MIDVILSVKFILASFVVLLVLGWVFMVFSTYLTPGETVFFSGLGPILVGMAVAFFSLGLLLE